MAAVELDYAAFERFLIRFLQHQFYSCVDARVTNREAFQQVTGGFTGRSSSSSSSSSAGGGEETSSELHGRQMATAVEEALLAALDSPHLGTLEEALARVKTSAADLSLRSSTGSQDSRVDEGLVARAEGRLARRRAFAGLSQRAARALAAGSIAEQEACVQDLADAGRVHVRGEGGAQSPLLEAQALALKARIDERPGTNGSERGGGYLPVRSGVHHADGWLTSSSRRSIFRTTPSLKRAEAVAMARTPWPKASRYFVAVEGAPS